MSKYIINKNIQDSDSGNNYEVHNEDTCTHLPLVKNRIDLGYFDFCNQAVTFAKNKYPNNASLIDGCYYCSESCNTG